MVVIGGNLGYFIIGASTKESQGLSASAAIKSERLVSFSEMGEPLAWGGLLQY